jgi:hypothetical protein
MSEWIDVKERLPTEEGKYYLVLTGESEDFLQPEILRYEGNVGVVKYWIPLPPPPKKRHLCIHPGKPEIRIACIEDHGRLFLVKSPEDRELITSCLFCPFCGGQVNE